ncbi:sensory histidine kinase DcuS [compost metagenome]
MLMDVYDIVYLLSNIFGTYTLYKFMSIFFERNELNPKLELIVYLSYFLVIGSIHIIFSVPILNMLSNFILFFLITALYSSSLKLRVTAVVYIYAILISVETITIIMFSLLDLNKHAYSVDVDLILSLIVSKILSYTVVLVISNFKMLKTGIEISPLHWFAVVGIPFGTLFSTFMLMTESNNDNLIQLFISITILFLINFFVFYLYDVLIQSYQEKMERNLFKQQNNAYMKQLKIITESQENIKIIRHDIKLHISTLQGLIEKGNNDVALDYIQNIYHLASFTNEYAKSNNTELDSILNYKIYEAQKLGIEIKLHLNVPEQFNFRSIDIVIIVGNLLDNAIEATSKLQEKENIELSIDFSRNVLYIRLINSYSGDLIIEDHKIKTTHADKENHGLGLQSVQKSLAKYNGSINLDYTGERFCVDVLLYNPVNVNFTQ